MTERRSKGDGGLHWDGRRQRWIATVTVGYDGRGKRIVKKGSGRTKTEAKRKLREVLRDHEDGIALGDDSYTVRQAVEDWLAFGLGSRDSETRAANESLCRNHVIPLLGARRLRDLTAREVDAWLLGLSEKLSTRTLRGVRACLVRSVNRAMARDKVKRNVVLLCSVPTGRPGRPSKSLTTDQARDVLTKTAGDWMHNYIVVSLLTGARTEELRALQWQHVHLEGMPHASPPIPAYVEVWRSVRAGGDTKTRRSRRTLALPSRAVEALRRQRVEQAELRLQAGERWTDHGLVFPSKVGTPMDRNNALRAFRSALVKVPGLDPAEWSPRELRHSFVSLLSDSGVSLEEISRLVGHSGTSVTELVYRHQIRPVLQTGAVAMDSLFGTGDAER
ncbi:site-specific integrase [Terrabacter sp. MAHUQ-38]|uniref:site-specific integrase n=1 Tax=unclassified Terrabacter TaxID=2630222 RepID=UPI00165E43B6|nr:tyrosine-type recombinase/integrase [Terrabacter sp. MAHUQ-38]